MAGRVLVTGANGPCDFRITPTTRYLLNLLDGIAMTGLGGFNYVDVRDVALAHVRALERGVPGERYIVASENLTMEALGRILGEMTGISITHLPAPRWFALPLVRALEGVSRSLGREPLVTISEARAAVDRYSFFDNHKAAAAFDLHFRGTREALEQAIRWMVFMRALKAKTMQRLQERFPPDESWRP